MLVRSWVQGGGRGDVHYTVEHIRYFLIGNRIALKRVSMMHMRNNNKNQNVHIDNINSALIYHKKVSQKLQSNTCIES